LYKRPDRLKCLRYGGKGIEEKKAKNIFLGEGPVTGPSVLISVKSEGVVATDLHERRHNAAGS